MAQAYLDELNLVVNRTSTSSAHQERVFIERRLSSVKGDLDRAQRALSEFSSTHSTIDLREQTRATVEAGARLEGELISAQGELDSILQIYGRENVRVRSAEARIADLKRELVKLSGTSAELPPEETGGQNPSAQANADDSYPPLRQLPRLAVPYTNLYRDVQVQETVYQLLTQQYEIARIQEAKDVPVLSVIDAPAIAEKKSFPPRTLLIFALPLLALLASSVLLLGRHYWNLLDSGDPRRALASEIRQTLENRLRHGFRRGEGGQQA
jgi:capsule polysaccharide export protein KpsE/RkpR